MLKFSAIFWPVALVTFSLLFQFYFFSFQKTIKRSDNSFFLECVLDTTFMVLCIKLIIRYWFRNWNPKVPTSCY